MSSRPLKTLALSGAGLLGVTAIAALIARSRLPVRDDPTDGEIALVSIFDGTAHRPTSDEFRGGSVVSMFGGTQLDLRRASLGRSPAMLRVTTIFGGTDITVPDGWRVWIHGPTVAGGVRAELPDDSAVPSGAPNLEIDARTVLGGLQVVARPVLRAAGESA